MWICKEKPENGMRQAGPSRTMPLHDAPHRLQGRGAVARPRRDTSRWCRYHAIRWPRPGHRMRLLDDSSARPSRHPSGYCPEVALKERAKLLAQHRLFKPHHSHVEGEGDASRVDEGRR